MRRYYSHGTRDVCHAVKDRDVSAIVDMASILCDELPVGKDVFLIPAPQHTGFAEYTKDIADIVAEKTGASVLDILRCVPREPLYIAKKQGKSISPGFYLCGTVPDYGKLFFVDNVIATGTSFLCAKTLLSDRLKPLIYAVDESAGFII